MNISCDCASIERRTAQSCGKECVCQRKQREKAGPQGEPEWRRARRRGRTPPRNSRPPGGRLGVGLTRNALVLGPKKGQVRQPRGCSARGGPGHSFGGRELGARTEYETRAGWGRRR